jgi:hypothetical protein
MEISIADANPTEKLLFLLLSAIPFNTPKDSLIVIPLRAFARAAKPLMLAYLGGTADYSGKGISGSSDLRPRVDCFFFFFFFS